MHYHFGYPFNPTQVSIVTATIEAGAASDIIVTYDNPPTTQVNTIRYSVDDAASLAPASTSILGNVLTITAQAPFVAGEVVEWFDAVGIHPVTNNLV